MGEVKKIRVYNLYPLQKFNIKISIPQQYISFILDKTSMAIANSLRRVCEAEINTKRLSLKKLKTNDAFMIEQYLRIQIGTLVINQNASLDKTFILDKKIKTPEDQNITTSDISNNTNIIPTNNPIIKLGGTNRNRPILTKEKDEVYIHMEIGIVENSGYRDGRHSQCCVGSAVIQPIDEKPFAYGGKQSTNSLPTSYYIKMISRGGMTATELLINAIDNIKTRLTSVESMVNEIRLSEENKDLFMLKVTNETATIGELFLTEYCALYENGIFFTYKEIKDGIEFRTLESDMKNIIFDIVKSLISKFNKLQKEFEDAKDLKKPIDVYGAKDLSARLIEDFGDLPYLNNGKNGYIHL
jgi:hypothetical protein